MGRFYGLKIKAGEMRLEQVSKLRKATEKWLEENPGFDPICPIVSTIAGALATGLILLIAQNIH